MNITEILTIALIILVLILFRYVRRNLHYWKNKNIPYITPLPFVGNIGKVIMQKASIGTLLHEIYNSSNSPYLGFFLLGEPSLLIRSPDLIKSVLIKDFDNFCNRSVTENHRDDPLGSNILFALKNPTWRQFRLKLGPIFSAGKTKPMFPLIEEAADELTAYIANMSANKKSIIIMEISGKYSIDIISSCAFGINSHCFKDENAVFRVMARRLFDSGLKRTLQMASYFFAPSLVKLFKMKLVEPVAGNFLKNTLSKIIFERENTKTVRGDVIDCLMQLRKENENSEHKIDGDVLAAQAVMYFMAGYETIGATFTWLLYELSVNSEIQTRLRREIMYTYEKNEKFSYDAIHNMKYLDMVLNETLRKYPVAPFLERQCIDNYHLPDGDNVIEKGTSIFISTLGLQRDPMYFPNPDKFDPERFSEENKILIPNNTYMPFGDGPRKCAGPKFAELGIKVAITKILTRFQIEATEKTPIPATFLLKGLALVPKEQFHLKFVLLTNINDGR